MNIKKMAIALVSAATLTSAINVKAETIDCEGSSTVGPLAKAFAEYYMEQNEDVKVTVSESGSGNGAKAICADKCDVADMSRPMKDKEYKVAVDAGVNPVAHVIALDGMAIAVHKSNGIRNVTMDQVKDIYLGKITNWKQLGGSDLKIVIINRDTNSGTYETFNKLVMKKEKIVDSAETVGSNGAVRSRVQSTKGAIGYLGLGFVEGVKALTVNNVEATPATIQNGTYPIARPLFMYTNGYPKMGSHLYKFINIYLTRDGQEIVSEIGFVPVTSYKED